MASAREFNTRKLRKLKPDGILAEKKEPADQLAGCFLVLALVFNDIKALTTFQGFISEFRKPDDGEISGHAGVYGGLRLHILKMSAGLLNEFLKFIRENRNILESQGFKQHLQSMSRDGASLWNLLITTSGKKNPGSTKEQSSREKFEELLARIRNETAFHYAQSSEALILGYRSKFFGVKNKGSNNIEAAYYSGGSMTDYEGTRFYYADAALQGYLEDRIASVGELDLVVKDMYDLLIAVSKIISGILTEYHKTKPSV